MRCSHARFLNGSVVVVGGVGGVVVVVVVPALAETARVLPWRFYFI